MRKIDDQKLLSLDLLAFNNGVNPYNDDSIKHTFKFGTDCIRNLINEMGVSGKNRILDIGGGWGNYAWFLAEVNNEVIILDRNEAALRIAEGVSNELGLDNIKTLPGDISLLKDMDASQFDAIWIRGTLMFLDKEFTLNECYRLLKGSGLLYVGAYKSTGRLLKDLISGYKRGGVKDGKFKYAMNSLRTGKHFSGRGNYLTLSSAKATFKHFGFEVTKIEPTRFHQPFLGIFTDTIDLIAEKVQDPTNE